MHPWLALVSFWRVLFGRTLPAQVATFLPPPAPKALSGAERIPKPANSTTPTDSSATKSAVSTNVATGALHRDGALALLALLQREGRFVDFVRQPLDGFDDAQIGAAARDVHRGCRRVIDHHLTFEPVMPGDEESTVSVPRGFDPAEIRLVGEAKGEPPYRGTLRHHGWRVTETKLPTLATGVDRTVIAPAEVELPA